jgi:hypothetical protein
MEKKTMMCPLKKEECVVLNGKNQLCAFWEYDGDDDVYENCKIVLAVDNFNDLHYRLTEKIFTDMLCDLYDAIMGAL